MNACCSLFLLRHLSVPLSLVSRPPILVSDPAQICFNTKQLSPEAKATVFWYDGWHQVQQNELPEIEKEVLSIIKADAVRILATYKNPITEEKLIFGGSGLHLRNRIITCAHNVRKSVFDHRTNQSLPLIELQYTKDFSAIYHICKRYNCERIFSGEDDPNHLWDAAPMISADGNQRWDLINADVAILETKEKSETQHDIAAKLPENADEFSVILLGFPGFQSQEEWIQEGKELPATQTYEFVVRDLFGGCEHKIASKGQLILPRNGGTLAAHKANALKGLSGGPVFLSNGSFIGIHLGGLGSTNAFLPVGTEQFEHVRKNYLTV